MEYIMNTALRNLPLNTKIKSGGKTIVPIMKVEATDLPSKIERLFRTDRKKYLGFIRQRVRSIEEAEDILQDVFANVLAAAHTVDRPIENIASWVFTAVRNRIIDSYRKKKAENFSDMQTPSQAEDGMDSYESFIGNCDYSPDFNLERDFIWDTLQESLK